MSNQNNSIEKNNNPLNIILKQPSKNNIQETTKIPKNIGPYQIIKKLKDGGYSKIYLAESKYTGDNVCIKLIEKIPFQENVEDLLLATRQMETLKVLKHRNILSLLEIYESPNFIILITEYLPGKDLIEHLIIKKRFNEEEAQKIFFQLLDALYYMHKMNICHRDIRTEHILFDKNKTPKIIGFSYSTFYNKNIKLKDSFGSLCYACPEIIQEHPYDPELADVWSLGVVLYVMVCGYLPFSEEDDNKNRNLIINGKIEFPKEISNKLKDLLKHMLDINSKKRYNFIKIMKHPWFKPFNEELLIGGCNLYKMIYPVDEKILNIIQIYNFKKKIIENDLKNNKYNIGTGLYRQLVIKLNEMGFKSISDLGCKEYLNYKNEKNNYYQDGENKYNNYLNKVQEKIEKIEKFISDYQEKEENIIHNLNNLELNISMANLGKSKNYNSNNSNNSDSNKNSIIISEQNSEKDENEKINNLNNNNKFEESNEVLKTINKKICHRRTLTPMFAFKEFDDKEMLNTEIGHINKNELEIINKSKKSEKRKNIKFNINKELNNNSKENHIFSNKRLFHSKSLPNKKNLFIKILNSKMRCSYKNRNSKNIDITKRIDDSHNITASYTKWRDTSMIIRRKKNYLNSSSFLDGYLKKTHPDNLRRNDVKNSLLYDINQIIIEENNNNSIINNSGTSNKQNNEIRKSRQIKYSLSFGEDDDEDEDESSYISKIDSKQVSIYDIDEELKVLKEMGNNIKSPNLKANTNNNNTSNIKAISTFNEKNQNFIRNSKNIKKIKNISNIINNINENPIIFNNNQAEMSFHEDKNKITNTNSNSKSNSNKNNYSININNTFIRSNSTIESNNKNNNNFCIQNKDRDKNNPIFKSISYNLNQKQEKKEINIFYNDKKKISKLNLHYDEFLFINYIDTKQKSKFLFSYFKDNFIIKKLKINNLKQSFCFITDLEKIRHYKENKLKKKEEKEKEKEKEKGNNKYFNRNIKAKFTQRKTFDMMKTKEKNIVIIENNNNTTRKIININNSKEKNINGNIKNSNLKKSTAKKYKKKDSNEANNDLIDNVNSGIEKDKNKKIHKNIKFLNNINNNKEKKPAKKTKIQKSIYKSDINNRYHEELNFTNISDLSEIRSLSILSPSYMNTNITNLDNKTQIQNIYDNKENILFSNILPSKSNFISFDKSFQSQNQNKSKYQISNLTVSHENNIICFGKTQNNNNNEIDKNNMTMSHFYNNFNGIGEIKKIIDNSNSNININLDELNNTGSNYSNIFSNNTENCGNCGNISNYNNKKTVNNIDYLSKNNYNNNFIVTIKKRNLAEKLKEEIQKSFNKSYFNSPYILTNGQIGTDNIMNNGINNIDSDNINYNFNNNNLNNQIISNGNIPQSNGKKIREKIMRCSSMLTKNNKATNNPISNNNNTFVNNYNNNIPIRHYDLNQSQYVTQYININNSNENFNKNININNSISSINNQNEFFDDGNNIKSKDSDGDVLFLNSFQKENKNEEYEKQKKKNTIKIKKKFSNSVIYENGVRNNSVKQINHAKKTNIKSNGKTNNQNYNINNDNKKNKNILLKNMKYKCLNGNSKNIDLNSNSNVIILSKHKKNYDYNYPYPEKNITSSVPDLNYHRKNKNNNICQNNNNINNKNQNILSEFNLHKNKKNNKSINKKSSFNIGNEINYKYKKKNNMNMNINFDLNNNKKININKNKNNDLNKKDKNINHKSSMYLYNNIEKNNNIKTNREEDNKKIKTNKKGNNSSYKKERKKSGYIYGKALFI